MPSDSSLIGMLLTVAKDLGPLGGIVFFMWWNMRWVDAKLDSQRAAHERERIEWRDQFSELMAQYQSHMTEMRQMYESNVTLVKGYSVLAQELSGIITLTTQTMTELVQLVRNNMFCPLVRKAGPQG